MEFKPLRMMAAILIAGVISAAPTTAATADCSWDRAELPRPAGTSSSTVVAAAENGWFAGRAWGEEQWLDVVRWHNGKPEDVGRAFHQVTSIVDVNSSGVLAGWAGRAENRKAIAYRGGRYEYLPFPAGLTGTSAPVAINNAGDIAGMVDPAGRAVVWPAARPGTVRLVDTPPGYREVRAADIDEDGRVLLAADDDALVWSPDGGVVTIRSMRPQKLRNGRVIGQALGSMLWSEWNLATGKVTGYGIRAYPLLIDSGTTTAGVFGDDSLELGVWRDGRLHDVLAASTRFNDLSTVALTDDGVIAVTQYTETGVRAAVFRRTC